MDSLDFSPAATSSAVAAAGAGELPAGSSQALLDALPTGVLLLTPAGTVAYLNGPAAGLWGVAAPAIIGRTPALVQPAVLPPDLLAALAQPAAAPADYWLPHTRQWLALRAAPAPDAHRWIFWDNVTARHQQAEAELPRPADEPAQQALDRYYSLFQTMDEGVSILEIIYDEAGKPVDLRWVEVNPAFERITGLADVAGQLTSAFGPTEPYWLEAYDSVVKTGAPLRYENYHAGIRQWYRTHTSRIGGPASRLVVNVFEDITAPKRRAAHLALLAGLMSDFAPLSTVEEVMDLAGRRISDHLGLSHCAFVAIDQAAGEGTLLHDSHPAGRPGMTGTFRLAEFLTDEETQLLTAGQSLVVCDVADGTRAAGQAAAFRARGVAALVSTPYVANGRWVFALGAGRRTPGSWEPDETELLQEVAARVWLRLERARAEEALRASEATLTAVVDALPVGIGLLDDQGRLTLANDEMQRYLPTGIMPSQDVTQYPRWYAERPNGSQLPPTEFPGARALRGEKVVPGIEMRYTPAAGPAVWTKVLAVPFRDHRGQLAGRVTVIFNIDAQKRTEQALRHSEEQFRQFVTTSSDTFYRMSPDWQRMRLLAGKNFFAPHDDPRRPWVERYLPAEDQAATWAILHAAIAAKQPFALEHRVLRADGAVAWVSSRAMPVLDAQGALVEWFGAATDITARKRAEANLAFLADVGQDLVRLTNVDDTLAALSAKIGQYFELSRCLFVELDDAQQVCWVACGWSREGAVDIPSQHRLADFSSPALQQAARAGEMVVIDDVLADPRTDGAQYAAFQIHAVVTVPLRRGDEGYGLLGFYDAKPRHWQADELALMRELTARIWTRVERARTEEALRASEQQLRAFVTASSDTLYHMDADWQRMRSLQDKSFLAPTHHPSTTWLTQYIPPADQTAVQAAIRAAIAGRHFFELEHRVLRADGSVGWTFSRAVPILNEQGALVEWFGAASDISARKQAEEALRQSEEQLRTVANLVPDLLWRSNAQGDTTWYNQRWYEYTGQTPAEAAAYGWADAIHPDDREQSARHYRAAVLTGQPLQQEHRIRSAAGEYRWFLVQARPVGDEQGRVAECFGAATDIHQLKLAEVALVADQAWLAHEVAARTRELRESRDLLQSVFDTNLIALSVLQAVRDEAGAIQDFRLTLVSQQLERETGRTDLVGKRYAQEYPGIREAGLFDLAVRALETGQPQGMEYFYPHEGFFKWYVCQFVKLDDGVVATNLDITERKMAEQERLKNLRLLEQAEAVAGLGSWDYNLTTGALRWSDGMYHLFGLPLGSAVAPGSYLDAVLAEDRPLAEQLVRQLTAGEAFEKTLRLRVAGQVKTVRLKAVVLRDEAGQPVRVLGVDLDISELQRPEADNLRLRLTQQQALFEAVQAAQEEERKRMAESLHNGIGQILFATKLRLDGLPTPLLGPDAALMATRREADQLLAEAIRQTRVLSHELVPMTLEEFGLPAALQDIAQKMSTPQLRLRGHVDLDEAAGPLAPPLQLALYRMAQELAQNIVKHALGATEASLELETTPGWVLLRAEDNGPGFAPAPAADEGLGLRSIRDRVALLGGRLKSGSSPAGGAYVRIRIPLPVLPAS